MDNNNIPPEIMEAMKFASQLLLKEIVKEGVTITKESFDTGIDPTSFVAGFMFSQLRDAAPNESMLKDHLEDYREFAVGLRETVDV